MMIRRDPDDLDASSGDPEAEASVVATGAGDQGGEAACYAHLVCPECGAVTTEGHRAGCALAMGFTDD